MFFYFLQATGSPASIRTFPHEHIRHGIQRGSNQGDNQISYQVEIETRVPFALAVEQSLLQRIQNQYGQRQQGSQNNEGSGASDQNDELPPYGKFNL